VKIYYEAMRVMDDGEVVILGEIFKDDIKYKPSGEKFEPLAGHGETVFCKDPTPGHVHAKSCAVPFVDVVRPAMDAFFASWDAAPEDPKPVAMPKKSIQVVEDGKPKAQQVDDKDLAALDLVAPVKAEVAPDVSSK
jgi:hypothetical protein